MNNPLIVLGAIGLATAAPVATPADPRTPAARVADVAYRIARAGVARCPAPVAASGLTFQHLGQFQPADRPAAIRELSLDQGPAVLAVARGSPGQAAGLLPGDILIAVDERRLPPPTLTPGTFVQSVAQADSDTIDGIVRDALKPGATTRFTILRDGERRTVGIIGVATCPSRVHLARSSQTNAFADGSRVFVTTGLLRLVRSDDELAFVLAHEMAHNILAHAAEQRANGVRRDFTRVLGRSGRLLRGSERAADRLGVELMRDAGYDAKAAIAFLTRTSSGPSISFLSAHDSVPARVKRIREMLARPATVAASVEPVRP